MIVADTDVLIDALAGVNPERVRLELRRRALAGAAYRDLARQGAVIGKADLYVAGICLAARLPLLTRNRREFERVRGLHFA